MSRSGARREPGATARAIEAPATVESARQRQPDERFARIPEPARILLVGLILLMVALPLSLAAAGDGVLPGDVAIAVAIQRAAVPGADGLALAINWLGEGYPTMVVLALLVAILLALAGFRAEAVLVVAATALRTLSPLLKSLFGSPRPTADLVRIIEEADGLGFPSGHALGAVLVYGALFAIAPVIAGRRWTVLAIRVAAVVMIVATGLARVRTGAHWPSDVLGGYLWGGALLILLLGAYRGARRRGAVTERPE